MLVVDEGVNATHRSSTAGLTKNGSGFLQFIKSNHWQVFSVPPNLKETSRRAREEDRTFLYPQHNVPPTHGHKSFRASMSCISTPASPHCITARLLSIYLGWILHRHQGYLTSKPCQDTVSFTAAVWEKRLKGRKLKGGEETSGRLNITFGGVRQRATKRRNWKSEAMERVGGGALQQCCKGYSLSLIGWFAIRKLRDEDKLALYNDRGQDGPRMLYKESQEVFPETEVCIWAKAQIANSHHPFGCSSFTVNSIPAFTVECQPGSVMHNELAACVAVTNRGLRGWPLQVSEASATWSERSMCISVNVGLLSQTSD